MPTGYTDKLYRGEDQSFEDFAWSCARAFGALILMRDDPADAPIPEKFEPSTYHVEALARAEHDMALLEAMTGQEQTDLYVAEKAANKAARIKAKRERRQLADRYEAMLWKVQTWEPPTPDHAEFKAFMVEQLKSSIDFDCHPGHDVYPPLLPENVSEWWAEKLRKAQWDVDYHRRSLAEELERTDRRNAWVGALRSSLDGAHV